MSWLRDAVKNGLSARVQVDFWTPFFPNGPYALFFQAPTAFKLYNMVSVHQLSYFLPRLWSLFFNISFEMSCFYGFFIWEQSSALAGEIILHH